MIEQLSKSIFGNGLLSFFALIFFGKACSDKYTDKDITDYARKSVLWFILLVLLVISLLALSTVLSNQLFLSSITLLILAFPGISFYGSLVEISRQNYEDVIDMRNNHKEIDDFMKCISTAGRTKIYKFEYDEIQLLWRKLEFQRKRDDALSSRYK
jgi:hypothetical protein